MFLLSAKKWPVARKTNINNIGFMHSRISQFREENRHKHLMIKQGINKHRVLGNSIENPDDGLGNTDCSKQN